MLEALDPDIGLGYPVGEKFTKKDSLLAYWSLPSNQQAGLSYVMRPIDVIMQKKLFEYNIARDTEIILTDEDVADLRENWDDLPLTLSAKIELVDDDLYMMDGVGNPSAANLIARFSHCEKEIEEFICEITQKEQSLTGKNNRRDRSSTEIAHWKCFITTSLQGI